ncbi:flavin monoamine oxidase family protein [Conexibacter woesei]|uniref:Amine oxidase n=1 Tax=Conexibacter woesei (strain DSM 14684 / CCUG 47730 / CIP 108061 / JCM 11494 / NBRC 100937 / ID131577) TaxID=469383 RepID=D3F6C6_CONWI|nr:NAD(P)/FAD-dependent oxidoreductase [Conexibacter woesei]ADB50693.1 amine oxidase [Conexibacter woesei DSM 14684]
MEETSCDAIVVGGGFAGVTAARELSNAGLSTTLLEARDRLGGRTWTSQFGSRTVELGGGWVHWRQPHVWAEMTRSGIGIAEDDWRFDTALFGAPVQRHPPEEAFARVRELFTRFAGDAGALLPHPHDPLRVTGVAALDARSMQDRLDEMRLTGSDEEWLSGLLYEIAGSPLDEAALLQVVRWMALSDWDIDRWYDTNRYRPVGGTVAVLDGIVASGRFDVQLSAPVSAVDAGRDAVRVVTRDGRAFRASTVVIATPVNVWPHIDFGPGLPAAHREAGRVGWGKPHQDKVWIEVRGSLGRVFGQLPAPAPLNFFWTHEAWEGGQLIIGINANPALDVTDEEQVAATIRRYVPEIDEVVAVSGHDWAADEYTRGGNTGHRPQQVTRNLHALQQPWGRVAFATADIASGWFGYIDGAIESGIRAARDCRAILAR